MISTGVLPGLLMLLQATGPGWQPAPSLPRPAAWNAVAAVEAPGGPAIVGVLGEGWASRWDMGSDAWTDLTSVPVSGRLSATAVTVGGRVLVLGGRSKDGDGVEFAATRVDVYDPVADAWASARPMPVASTATVAGAWRDSLVYLIGAHRGDGAEALVQVYDPASDVWFEATPPPGLPVSAHAGTVARDALVFLGRGEAGSGPTAWRGDIDPLEPAQIRWRRLADPGGPSRFGVAAVGIGTRVLFVGGGTQPAGSGSEPRAAVTATLIYDLVTNSWRSVPGPGFPTMAHGLVRAGGWLFLVGGTNDSGAATDGVWRISILDAIASEG